MTRNQQGDMKDDKLVVAILGTGRMAAIHLEALARMRDDGLEVDGRRVSVVPVVYGRNPAKVAELAGRYGVTRTSSEMNELLDAADVDVVDNCLVNALHYE